MHKMGYRTEMRDLKPDQRTLTRICVNVCRGLCNQDSDHPLLVRKESKDGHKSDI